MVLKTLISISGQMASGKDTAGACIVRMLNELGHDARIIKLADPVYEEARGEYGMTDKDVPLLQHIGKTRTDEDDYHYVKIMMDRIYRDNDFEVFVCTDVRRQAEYDAGRCTPYWVPHSRGLMVRLWAPLEVRQQRVWERDKKWYPHEVWYAPTEVGLDHITEWDMMFNTHKIAADIISASVITWFKGE